MNERYLFRAKYAGTIPDFIGRWVTGDCVYLGGKAYIHPQNNITQVNKYDITKLLIVQCTGLRDKNGALIFEGDIVRVDEWDEEFAVVWRFGGWCLNAYDNYENLYDVVENNNDTHIVGNIYDKLSEAKL